MVIGLRIDVNGVFHRFNYNWEDLLNRRLKYKAVNRGEGNFKLLEYFDTNNKTYLMYGWEDGSNFNSFDLNSCNATGDIICHCIILDGGMPIDVVLQDLERYYADDNLEDYLAEDELEELDNYDFSDSFIENDINDLGTFVSNRHYYPSNNGNESSSDGFGSIDYADEEDLI